MAEPVNGSAPEGAPAEAPLGAPTRRFDAELTPGKLFVGGLDTRTTQDTLVDYCAAWGALSDSVIMPGRGFGFITFADSAAADKFVAHKDHIVDGKRIEAKRAVPRPTGGGGGGHSGGQSSAAQPTHKLFVGGTGELTDEEFRSHFEQYGELEDAVVVRNPQGSSRGFGFVTFKSLDDSEKCFHADHLLMGRRVELKRAVPKGESVRGAPAGGMKENDWRCNSCSNVNFAWRERCNRCQEARPFSSRPRAGAGMRGGGGMGMGGGMMGGMGGGMGGYGGMDGGMGGYGGMPMGMGYGGMGMGGGYGNTGGMMMGGAGYGGMPMGGGAAMGPMGGAGMMGGDMMGGAPGMMGGAGGYGGMMGTGGMGQMGGGMGMGGMDPSMGGMAGGMGGMDPSMGGIGGMGAMGGGGMAGGMPGGNLGMPGAAPAGGYGRAQPGNNRMNSQRYRPY